MSFGESVAAAVAACKVAARKLPAGDEDEIISEIAECGFQPGDGSPDMGCDMVEEPSSATPPPVAQAQTAATSSPEPIQPNLLKPTTAETPAQIALWNAGNVLAFAQQCSRVRVNDSFLGKALALYGIRLTDPATFSNLQDLISSAVTQLARFDNLTVCETALVLYGESGVQVPHLLISQ
jgi:hypothetical protein